MKNKPDRDRRPFRLEEYLLSLDAKGFKFKDDAISFIYFGKQSTGASDFIVSLAIEWTIKTQKRFDGSFYLALLESLVEQNIKTRREAAEFLTEQGILKGGPV